VNANRAAKGEGAHGAHGHPRSGLHRVECETGRKRGVHRRAAGMEREPRRTAGDPDVGRAERDDARELQDGHDEERGREGMWNPQRGPGQGGGRDPSDERAADPREHGDARLAQRRHDRARAQAAAACEHPRAGQRQCDHARREQSERRDA
jgi:hypothetical protein